MALNAMFKVATSTASSASARVVSIFESAVSEGKSASAAIKQLQAEGLSYRRTNMLADYRRAQHVSRVKIGNVEGELKAHQYFDRVVEPFRKQEGLTYKQALDRIHKWEKGQYETTEQAIELEDYANRYGFSTTP